MFATFLPVILEGEPILPPVLAADPLMGVYIEGHRLANGFLSSMERSYMQHGTFTVEGPLRVAVDGKLYPNPGLYRLTQLGEVETRKVEVYRDGQRICWGLIETPDVDENAGWLKLTCRDMSGIVTMNNHGVGANTGWVIKPGGGDDLPVANGWTGVNGSVTSAVAPLCAGSAVEHGTERTNPWHFMYQAFTIPANNTLELKYQLMIAKGAPPPWVTCVQRDPRFPKSGVEIPISLDPAFPSDRWSETQTLSIEGDTDGSKLIEIAVWSPMPDKGSNACAMTYKLTPKDDPTDPIHVPVGGKATDLAAQCFIASAAQDGIPLAALSSGTGFTFTDNVLIPPEDLSTWDSHLSALSPVVEWIFNPDAGVVYCTAPGEQGTERWDLHASTSLNARTPITAITGASGRRRLTITATNDHGDTYARTEDSGHGIGDRVETAPANLGVNDVAAFAELMSAQTFAAGRPTTVLLPPPPNGRTSGDWLLNGLQIGDRVPVTVEDGPFYSETLLRITGLRYEPTNGDRLFATLEPIP